MIFKTTNHIAQESPTHHRRNQFIIAVPLRGILDFPYTHSLERWEIGIVNERGLS